MDKKTFVQFLIISSVILAAWWVTSFLLFRGQPMARRPERRVAARVPGPAPAAAEEAEEIAQPVPGQPLQDQPELVDSIVLANELIRTEWTNRGASLQRLTLLDERYKAPYKVEDERPPLVLLQDFQSGLYSDTIEKVTFNGRAAIDRTTADVIYEVKVDGQKLVFETVVGDEHGRMVKIKKTVTIPPGSYQYDVALEFENVCEESYEISCALRAAAGIERESLQTMYLGTRVGVMKGPDDYKVTKVSPKKLSKKGPQANSSANIAWAGVVNHYFMAILVPEDRDWVESTLSRSVTDTDILQARGRWGTGTIRRDSDRPALAKQNAAIVINTTPVRLEPGGTLVRRYKFIAAPKQDKLLASYGEGLSSLVEFGMFRTLSRLVLSLLNGIHSVLPNYGVAILLLTAIIRLVLHPLTRKSQMSMTKMQRLQPHIVELQKKHGDDKQKATQAQMELFRKHGVSPLSGCWPMFLQLPVLFSLFGALRAAIELRHAGFVFWMQDLSQPDALFHFPFYLPILGNEFNVLPILVMIVMLVNQRFTPKPATDQARQQQKMMKFMPVMLGFIFYRMPSGLCLYFTASMGIGALERWLIEKKAEKTDLTPVAQQARKAKRRAPVPQTPKKTGWLEKLQNIVEKQHKATRQAKRPKNGK